MKFTFIVFISDKIWSRYTRRPHFSGLAEFGELIVIEYPVTILSKIFLRHPINEIKYYLKYSAGERVDKLSGAKIVRPIILFPPTLKIVLFEFINRKLVSLFILSLKTEIRNKIYFLSYYNQAWLVSKKSKNRMFVLEMNDEWSLIKYEDQIIKKIKDSIYYTINKVDLVIAVTKKLRDKYNINGKAYYLPNAVDISHYVPDFDKETIKKKETALLFDKDFLSFGRSDPNKYIKSIEILKKIVRPAVGSISGLSGNWSDFEFMKEVEELLPNYFNMVSSGNIFPPTKKEFLAGYKKYINNPRMVFLGHLDYSILPDFLEKIDVGIVMHRMDHFNTHSAPNKIWAYLAMGLPVVSTNFLTDPDKEIFEGLVCFANTPLEFVQSIIKAYESDNQQLKTDRRKLAVKNSTFNRAKKLLNIIEEKFDYKSEG